MPMESKAQNRLMHWAAAHPEEAAKRGIKPKVAHDFVEASHGQRVRDLPERVGRAQGGRAPRAAYPKPFRW